jgi:cytochrome c-type biogenesis protein CcmH/NrfF
VTSALAALLAAALLAAARLATFVASALSPLLATLLTAPTGTFLKATTRGTTSVLAMRLRCFVCFFQHVLFSFSFSLRLLLLFQPPP